MMMLRRCAVVVASTLLIGVRAEGEEDTGYKSSAVRAGLLQWAGWLG